MATTAKRVWDDELARAAQWVAFEKSQAQDTHSGILARIHSHLKYLDQKNELKQDEQDGAKADGDADEQDDDLGLGLDLNDVSFDELQTLLAVEARGQPSAAPSVVAPTPAAAPAPVLSNGSSVDVHKPIEMPAHLAQAPVPPAQPVAHPPAPILVPGGVGPMRHSNGGSAAPSHSQRDRRKHEKRRQMSDLADELDLHAMDLASSDEERKCEERGPRPPEQQEQPAQPFATSPFRPSVAATAAPPPPAQPGANGQQRPKSRNKVVDSDSEEKSDEQDEIAMELLGMVTGERDPEVIKYKESKNLRRQRRVTSRFGTATLDEQIAVRSIVKYYTGEEDRESSMSSDAESDFSMPEEVEPDDPVSEEELLSDDFLATDNAQRPKKSLRRLKRGRYKKKTNRKPPTPGVRRARVMVPIEPSITAASLRSTGPAPAPFANGTEEMQLHNSSKITPSVGANGGEQPGSPEQSRSAEPIILRLKVPKSFLSTKPRPDPVVVDLVGNTDSQNGDLPPSSPEKDTSLVDEVNGMDSNSDAGTADFNDLEQDVSDVEMDEPAEMTTTDEKRDVSENDDAPTQTTKSDSEILAAAPVTSVDEVDDGYGTDELVDEDEGSADVQASPNAIAHGIEEQSGENANDDDDGYGTDELEDPTETVDTSGDNLVLQHESTVDKDHKHEESEIAAPQSPEVSKIAVDVPEEPSVDVVSVSVSVDSDFDPVFDEEPDEEPTPSSAIATKEDEGPLKSPTETIKKVETLPDTLKLKKHKPKTKKTVEKITEESNTEFEQFFAGEDIEDDEDESSDDESVKNGTPPIVSAKIETAMRTEVKGTAASSLKEKVKPVDDDDDDAPLRAPQRGKYKHERRTVKIIDDGDEKSMSTSRNQSVLGKRRVDSKSKVPTDVKRPKKTSLAAPKKKSETAKTSPLNADDEPRYLSYGTRKEQALSSSAAKRSTPPKKSAARYGGGGFDLKTTVSTTDTSTSGSWSFATMTISDTTKHYPREQQLNVYDALHVERPDDDFVMDRDRDFKRPSVFKKNVEEAEWRGINFVTSRQKEVDLEKLPIPKKKPSSSSHYGTSRGASSSESSRGSYRKESTRKDSSNRDARYGSDRGGMNEYRSKSPPSKWSSVDGLKGRDHKSSYSSRAESPRTRGRKDRYSSSSGGGSHYGPQAQSRSHSHSRSRSRSRDRSQSTRDRRRGGDSPPADKRISDDAAYWKKKAKEMEELLSRQQSQQSAIPQNPLNDVRDEPVVGNSGALQDFDSDSVFISDSDGDDAPKPENKPAKSVRVNLETIPVDSSLLRRCLYFSGINGAMDECDLTAELAPYDVEVSASTHMPAIQVFICQRNHRPRGDALVIFKSAAAAEEALRMLHKKPIKNSIVRVRKMDQTTYRILQAQHNTARMTWTCASRTCRAEVSVWVSKCEKCQTPRRFAASGVCVGETDWLCAICFAANNNGALGCSTCGASTS